MPPAAGSATSSGGEPTALRSACRSPGSARVSSPTVTHAPHLASAELNLRPGHDLAVVGFDGSVGAGLLHPPLTSVVMPVEDIAGRVVGRVLRQIETGQDTEPGDRRDLAARRREHPGPPVTAARRQVASYGHAKFSMPPRA